MVSINIGVEFILLLHTVSSVVIECQFVVVFVNNRIMHLASR
jgi:hypothetical protein